VTSLSLASLGATSQLSALVKDQNGTPMSGATVTWATSAASIAMVSSTGLVTAVKNGTAAITATSGAAIGTASASIQQVAVSITLSPDSLVFSLPSDTATVTATMKDAGGSEMIVSPTLTWASSDTTTVKVSGGGLVNAVASGFATVTAQAGDVRATVSARVSGSNLAVTVTGDGDPLSGVSVWLTDSNGTHTKKITGSEGTVLFRNLRAGEHTVTLQQVPTGLTGTNPQTVQVSGDQVHDLVFAGSFPPAQITGTATSWNQPVVDALVTIEGKDTVEVTVNSAGVFQVDSVLKGDYTLTISNYTGVRFKENTFTRTLQSGANTTEFIGRPHPEPTWASVSNGNHHTCGVTTVGEAYCWGDNTNGVLGDGTTAQRTTPTLVSGGATWTSVTGMFDHTCGVTTFGEAYCWGGNIYGQLGDGTTTPSGTPVLVGGGLTWASVSGGLQHTCGLRAGGLAYCWGGNDLGQLGDGTTTRRTTPTLVSGGLTWASVNGGYYYTCGVTTAGLTYCWGRNANGQIGDSTTTQRNAPTLVSGGHAWASVSAGWRHTCGVTTAGEAYCWGANEYAQLGDGTTTPSGTPVLVGGGLTWASISSASSQTCGVTIGGEAYCWGRNANGELGDGTTTQRITPTLVSGGLTWLSVIGSLQHTCGVTTEGEAYCWGHNLWGELGDNTTTNSPVPVKVGGSW
jgi:alpha-tubulin suppressor-like RCC1 family protein